MEVPLPWAFCWSGNISGPATLLQQEQLLFDENFVGWGAEDLEWAFRLTRAGATVLFNKRPAGFHQPHYRNVQNNMRTERASMPRFLEREAPLCLLVEAVVRYNDIVANKLFREISGAVRNECPPSVQAKVTGLGRVR